MSAREAGRERAPADARRRIPSAAAVVLLVLCLTMVARGEQATDEPPPTPGLALSDKPQPGCCCISGQSPPRASDCFFGLQRDKCMTAGDAFKNVAATSWTPGKCAGT